MGPGTRPRSGPTTDDGDRPDGEAEEQEATRAKEQTMTLTGRRPVERTARRGYVTAAVLAVVGVAGAGVWGGVVVLDRLDAPSAFVRAVPGEAVELDAGEYVLYVEGTTPGALGAVSVTAPDGGPVDLGPVADLRYDVPADLVGGRDDVLGTGVGRLEAEEPGRYALATEEAVPDDVRLAVGEDVARAGLRALLTPAAVAVLTLVTALALAARTAHRSSSTGPEAGR